MNKRVFGPVEIALLVGIVVFSLAGVAYAGLSGVVAIPGVPTLLADVPVPIASARPTISPVDYLVSPDESPIASPTSMVEASSSPEATVSPELASSPSASPTSAATSSPSPTPDAKTLAQQHDTELLEKSAPKLQVALKDYKAKHKAYPISTSYSKSWTDLPDTPLKVLVSEGFIDALPIDYAGGRIGYYSADGATYTITVPLQDTTNPAGHYVTGADGKQVYVASLASP